LADDTEKIGIAGLKDENCLTAIPAAFFHLWFQ
jgi:hypothetical protein